MKPTTGTLLGIFKTVTGIPKDPVKDPVAGLVTVADGAPINRALLRFGIRTFATGDPKFTVPMINGRASTVEAKAMLIKSKVKIFIFNFLVLQFF